MLNSVILYIRILIDIRIFINIRNTVHIIVIVNSAKYRLGSNLKRFETQEYFTIDRIGLGQRKFRD